MYASALMVETFRRRRLILICHFLFALSYAVILLLSLYPDSPPVPAYMFMATGMFLPLFLSVGIFGNDIASGRFRVLATEPIPLGAFYTWRVVGLILQAAVHVAVLSASAWLLHACTGKGNVDDLAQWAAATLALFASVAALSTTVSVITRVEFNSVAVFMLLPAMLSVYAARASTADPFWRGACDAILAAGRYALPPVELLLRAVAEGKPWPQMLGSLLHVLGLTLVYAVAGITLLERRQYKPQRA